MRGTGLAEAPACCLALNLRNLLGLVLTQPLGSTHITARPFVAANFQGKSNLDGPPSAGVMLDYRPVRELDLALTTWIGPGFEKSGDEEHSTSSTGADESETSEIYSSSILENWTGPDWSAASGGTLCFVDAKAVWLATSALTIDGEALLASDGPSAGAFAWGGVLLLANYDVTDRTRIFARWSFLDDNQGIVTGIGQHRHEISAGAAFQLYAGWELRGEYRHDFSDATGDLDALSAHITFSY